MNTWNVSLTIVFLIYIGIECYYSRKARVNEERDDEREQE